jgi:hypothetical protein
MNKEIMEMAEVIRRARQELGSGLILPEETATALFKAGYRKQSETVKEFAEKIVKKFGKSCSEYYPEFIEMTSTELYYLAEQYGKEEK